MVKIPATAVMVLPVGERKSCNNTTIRAVNTFNWLEVSAYYSDYFLSCSFSREKTFTMTIQPHYTSITREAFNDYLDNKIDLKILIERLRYIELQIMSDDEDEIGKGIWFRFFKGDTLKTTISDIEKDLRDPAHPNSRILKQGIAMGLQTDELEVHYT